MRVLTFNSHQPYIHLLATTLPWKIGVVIPRLLSGREKAWNPAVRPQPPNVHLYASVAAAIQDSKWDWILAHNVDDLIEFKDLPLPKVFLVHGTLSGRIVQDRSTINREEYLSSFRMLLDAYGCRVIYVSELKKRDWGIPGEVIRTAIEPAEYGGYRGEISGVLQVSNYLRERGDMLGWTAHQTVCRDLPHLLLGQNRNSAECRLAKDWDDLKEHYKAYRIYLHTAIHPYEDGFNLALMEAMATGMPVATIQNPSSPIEDGVEGVVGSTGEELREKVLRLLARPREATQIGQAARLKLQKEFPLRRFQSAWEALADGLK